MLGVSRRVDALVAVSASVAALVEGLDRDKGDGRARGGCVVTLPAALTSSAEYTAFEQRGHVLVAPDFIRKDDPFVKLADDGR